MKSKDIIRGKEYINNLHRNVIYLGCQYRDEKFLVIIEDSDPKFIGKKVVPFNPITHRNMDSFRKFWDNFIEKTVDTGK